MSEQIGRESLSLMMVKQRLSLSSRAAAIALLCCLCISPARAQSTPSGCGISSMTHQLFGHAGPLLRAMEHAPRNAIRLDNLKWELFIAAVIGVLIATGRSTGDESHSGQIHSTFGTSVVKRRPGNRNWDRFRDLGCQLHPA
jgi:hypothetical protein